MLFYHGPDPMLVLEINSVVGSVANYLCPVRGYLGKFLYYKTLTGWPWENLLLKKIIGIFRSLWYYWRRQWHPTPVLLPGKSHGQRSLVGCSPWGCEESDTTERLHFRFSLSCIGEGNGNPLQCPCLENPRDGGAWWAAVCGTAQSWTPLKRLKQQQQQLLEG